MADKKYTYRVKPGYMHGAFNQYGPGTLVELNEDEASGFLDKLELVIGSGGKKSAEKISSEDQATHIRSLTKSQLKELPEYQMLEAPKPIKHDDIADAILELLGIEAE